MLAFCIIKNTSIQSVGYIVLDLDSPSYQDPYWFFLGSHCIWGYQTMASESHTTIYCRLVMTSAIRWLISHFLMLIVSGTCCRCCTGVLWNCCRQVMKVVDHTIAYPFDVRSEINHLELSYPTLGPILIDMGVYCCCLLSIIVTLTRSWGYKTGI